MNEVLFKEAIEIETMSVMEKELKRRAYVMENKEIWLKNGKELKSRRDKHEMSLKYIGDLLGTSGTRVSKLEKGEPVFLAKNLTKSINLLFNHIELRKEFKKLFEDNKLNRRL